MGNLTVLKLHFWGRKKLVNKANIGRQFQFLASLPQYVQYWGAWRGSVASLSHAFYHRAFWQHHRLRCKTSKIAAQFIPMHSSVEPFWLFSQNSARVVSFPAAWNRKAPNVLLKWRLKLMWLILYHQENDAGMKEGAFFSLQFLSIQSPYGIRE